MPMNKILPIILVFVFGIVMRLSFTKQHDWKYSKVFSMEINKNFTKDFDFHDAKLRSNELVNLMKY